MSDTPNPVPAMTLADLKVGDKAVVDNRHGIGASRTIVTVSRVTKTQIVITGWSAVEPRFRRDNGRKIASDSYSFVYLLPGTPELLEKVANEQRTAKLANHLSDIKWRTIPLPILEQIYAALGNT